MFGWIKNKKQNNSSQSEEKEFSFIWYKKLYNGNKIHYTQPFRTKIKAKNIEEAKNKLTDSVIGKMTLCIIEENDFDSSEIMSIQKDFDKVFIEFENRLKKMFPNDI